MPRYDYHCHGCNQVFEASHGMSAEPLKRCLLCDGGSVERLISAPMINTIKSGSPTGAKYEKMSKKEIVDKEAAPLAATEDQGGMAEKLSLMYGGKLD